MARFAVSNPQDQSAASWIVAFLLLSYTTLTTMVRGFVKFSMLGLDDAVAVLAQLLAYGNALSVIVALRDGLAKSSPDPGKDGSEPEYGKALHASIVFYLLASATAKVTTVLFVRRIFGQSGHAHVMTMCKVAVAVATSWGIGSTSAVSAMHDMEQLHQPHSIRSFDGRTMWLAIAILDCAIEIALMVMVAGLVNGLQMTVRKKVGVCSAFAWRIGLIIMAIFHYRSYVQMIGSANIDIAVSEMVVWEQISICYSLLSITWPFSKVFINSFDTAQLTPTSAYGSASATLGRNAAKSKHRTHSTKLSSRIPWQSNVGHSSTVYSRPVDARQDDSHFGSQELIIRREDEVRVSYGQAWTSTASRP